MRALRHLAHIPAAAPVVLLVRHGEKAEKQPGIEDRDRPLTADGKESARAEGEKLVQAAAGRRVTVWHSPVGRCRETAEQIAAGAGVGKIQECPRLEGYPDFAAERKTKDDAIAREEARDANRSFKDVVDMLSAKDGYPGFPRPSRGAARFADFLLARAAAGINVNVSHDWIMYLAAFFSGAEKLPFTKARPGYLETLLLLRENNGETTLYYRNNRAVLPHSAAPPAVTAAN